MNVLTKYLFVLLLVAGTSACSKKYFDINENNPNNPNNVDVDLVLSPQLRNIAYIQHMGSDDMSYWMGYWTIGGGSFVNSYVFNYTFDNKWFQGMWTSYYSYLGNLQYIDQHANGNNFYRGIVKTMNVVCYHNLIDLFGNIPYTQALQIDKYPTPAYDDAATIYNDLYLQLDSARDLIKNWTGNVPKGDIMYNGNKANWIKFINTLQLRLILRVSQLGTKPPYYATALQHLLSSAASDGYIANVQTEGNVNPGFFNQSGKGNPMVERFWNISQNQQTSSYNYFRANAAAVNFYWDGFNGYGDWRLYRMYAPYDNNPDHFKGAYFGVPTANNDTLSGMSWGDKVNGAFSGANGFGIIKNVNQPIPMITAFESYFLQAEAAYRNVIPGDYKELYKNGVRANFTYIYKGSLPDPSGSIFYQPNDAIADANGYMTQASGKVNNFNIELTTDPLQTILSQKWISMNGVNPFEPYADFRRTGWPTYIYGSKYPGAPALPKRVFYPSLEYATNTANVKAQGEDVLTKKIFWGR